MIGDLERYGGVQVATTAELNMDTAVSGSTLSVSSPSTFSQSSPFPRLSPSSSGTGAVLNHVAVPNPLIHQLFLQHVLTSDTDQCPGVPPPFLPTAGDKLELIDTILSVLPYIAVRTIRTAYRHMSKLSALPSPKFESAPVPVDRVYHIEVYRILFAWLVRSLITVESGLWRDMSGKDHTIKITVPPNGNTYVIDVASALSDSQLQQRFNELHQHSAQCNSSQACLLHFVPLFPIGSSYNQLDTTSGHWIDDAYRMDRWRTQSSPSAAKDKPLIVTIVHDARFASGTAFVEGVDVHGVYAQYRLLEWNEGKRSKNAPHEQ